MPMTLACVAGFSFRCSSLALACMLASGSACAFTTGGAVVPALQTARPHAPERQTEAARNEAIRAAREAARLGSVEAHLELARMLWALTRDPPADVEQRWLDEIYPEALDWYRKAARAGSAEVKYELAVLLEDGGILESESLDWLREAAALGHGRAQYNYGVQLLQGVTLPRDDAAAAVWLERSAEQGYLEPQYLLATLHERGRGVARNRDVAMGRYRVAAQLGHPAARAVLRTAPFLDTAPCRMDQPAPAAWRAIASRIATLHVPFDATAPTIDDVTDALRVAAPGIEIALARSGDTPDEEHTIVLGGDVLAVQFSGDASMGTVTLRWPPRSAGLDTVRLDVAYAEPASRDIACRIAAGARLLDPVSDLELVRIEADASPPRALLRGERAQRWVSVDDVVTRDHGRVATIQPGQVEVIELIGLRGGRGWRERLVILRPSLRRVD